MVLGWPRWSSALSSARGKRGKPRRKVILVFGENQNDTDAIKQFILALAPDADVRVDAMRRPPVNLRDAPQQSIPDRVSIIGKLIDAAEVDADVIAVFAHEDCDAVEPSHLVLADRIEAAFHSRGYPFVWAATPAWETEAWLMLWPEAFEKHVPSWRPLNTSGRSVGLIENAKEFVARSVELPHGHGRGYRESDAPKLAEIVRHEGWIRTPAARSDSFNEFARKVDALSL